MELKTYQKKVMDNLSLFLQKINEENDIVKAWEKYWLEQDIKVGDKVSYYQHEIKGVPQVCLKVPTGGGKTFLACTSLKKIFDNLPLSKSKVVVWLVPSDPILVQTIKNLSNVNHPYRQKLDTEFNGRVGIYTKEMLLNAQNFSPDTIKEMLTICILSYDSLRSKKKDDRRIYKENGNLKQFADFFNDNTDIILNDIPETALIQTLRHLEPIVIVDESHNATSDLSVEMLANLNPSFILELTATPKEKSNIISFVSARELKKENMVKLPVIVYNRNSVSDVIRDSIKIRNTLEQIAKIEEQESGKYIRPIVLFQAQPKNSDDSETFEKIKKKLLEIGINEEEIAIKTANINELKEDLLSKDCKIRYIITVNALKEGWDCSFAYVLASLANKTSKVEVEQILGRILRQPYTQRYKNQLLNTSYVFTSSNDFHDTLENIIQGLNNAGFSKKDCRKVDESLLVANVDNTEQSEQLILKTEENNNNTIIEDVSEEINSSLIKNSLENTDTEENIEEIEQITQQVVSQIEDYNNRIEEENNSLLNFGEYSDMKNQQTIQEQYLDDIKNLKIPQFMKKGQLDLFGGEYSLLEPENLSEGFILNELDAKLKFDLATGEIYKVDIEENGEAVPKYKKISTLESEYLKKTIATKPKEEQIQFCSECLANLINKNNRYSTYDVIKYINRIIENMSEDELVEMQMSLPTCAEKIKEKIKHLETEYRKELFYKWIENEKIMCKENHILPNVITPLNTIDSKPLSLYSAELNDLNGLEHEVIDSIIGLSNIKWWHRNIENKGFKINGYINHYPDFIVMTKSNKLILIEVKGNDRDNSDSRKKLKLGRKWQELAGNNYKYFMVFKNQDFKEEGAYKIDAFINLLKEL